MKEVTSFQLRQRKTYKDCNMIRISTPDGPFSMQIEYLGHDIIFAGVPNDKDTYDATINVFYKGEDVTHTKISESDINFTGRCLHLLFNALYLDNQQKKNEYMTEEDYVEATNSLSI